MRAKGFHASYGTFVRLDLEASSDFHYSAFLKRSGTLFVGLCVVYLSALKVSQNMASNDRKVMNN